jgi:hypothetical protein
MAPRANILVEIDLPAPAHPAPHARLSASFAVEIHCRFSRSDVAATARRIPTSKMDRRPGSISRSSGALPGSGAETRCD